MCARLAPITDELEDLSTEDPYYEMAYANYLSLLNMSDTHDYLTDNIDKLVSETSGNWRMLSIGCGDGRLDLDLLGIITDRFPLLNIAYIGLEPNQSRKKSFEKSISSCGFLSRCHFHLEQIDLDGYDNKNFHEKFDLILCARVLYYMYDRLESTFLRLINKLTSKGKLLAIHQSPSGVAQMIHVVGFAQLSPAHYCNTYHLRQALQKTVSQNPFLKFSITYADNYLDINCFQDIHSTDESKREKALSIISFLLGKKLDGIDMQLLDKMVFERILPLFAIHEEDQTISYSMFLPIGVVIVEKKSK